MASLIWKSRSVVGVHTLKTTFLRVHSRKTVGTQHDHINVETGIQYGSLIPQLSKEIVGVSSDIGLRNNMEDRYSVAMLSRNKLFLAVYDGHGGCTAVDYTTENLHKHVSRMLETEISDGYQDVFKDSFLQLNEDLQGHLNNCSKGAERFSGTTAVVCLVVDGLHLHVAHVGDSRAILCRDGQAETLTWDHHPEHEDEKQRIEDNGGSVLTNSIGQAMVNGRLAMTRSIGDFDLKRYGVFAEPSYTYKKLDHTTDAFLVMATDGVTEVMSDEFIVSTVLSHRSSAQNSAERLTKSALYNHSYDNVTAMVLPLGAWQNGVDPALKPKQNFMRLHSRVRD